MPTRPTNGFSPTQPVRGVYRSLVHRELLMIDKGNGGKADAINAGVNAAKHPLVCVIDADSLLEEHALTRAVLPFLEDPTTIAAGGIIRIANGCRVQDGRVTHVGLPSSALAAFQITEYLRAFLVGRVAQSVMNGLLIISGAFGLFRRDALLSVGGFRTDTVGEDMEVVVRLHRSFQERGEKYRIVFRPDPVCWTEVPERIGHAGAASAIAGTAARSRRCIAIAACCSTPTYGAVGLLATPFFLIFEALAPLVEAGGYVATVAGLLLGRLDWQFAQLFFLAAVVYGALISVAAGDPRRGLLPPVSAGGGSAAARDVRRPRELRIPANDVVVAAARHVRLPAWARGVGNDGETRIRKQERGGVTGRAAGGGLAAWRLASARACRRRPWTSWRRHRTAATSGHRAEALDSLRLRLDDAPRDVDARLLYGLILSWEGRYDEARQALQQVLVQSPTYVDARIALMNVSWWSGRSSEARDAADAILAQDPGNRQARDLRDRLDAASRPWWGGASYGSDSFSDRRELWHESQRVADPPHAARLGDRPRQRGAPLRAEGSDGRDRVLPEDPAGHLRLRRCRRRSGLGSVPLVSRRLRPVSVSRRRLRSLGRCSPPRLRRSHQHRRRHGEPVCRQLDADREGLPCAGRRAAGFDVVSRLVPALHPRRRLELRRHRRTATASAAKRFATRRT